MKKFRDLPIFHKFLLTFLMLVIIPCLGLMVFWSVNNYKIMEEKEKSRIQEQVFLIKTNVELELEKYETRTRDIYHYPALFEIYRESRKNRLTDYEIMELNNLLKGIRVGEKYLKSVCVFLENGQLIYGSANNYYKEEDIGAQTSWFGTVEKLDGKGMWFPAVLMHEYRKESYCLSYGFVVKDVYSDFGTVGTFFASVDVALIEKICNSVDLGDQSMIIITDADGFVVWSREEKWIGEHSDVVQNEIESREACQQFQVASDKNGWVYMAYVPKQVLYQQQNVILWNNLVILILLSACFVICIRIISKNIVTPIQKIAVVMDQFNTSGFEQKLTMTGKDEIGALAYSFIKMRNQIVELIQQIRTSEKKKRKEEIKALQAQINPHFLYNTLDTVYWMADEKGEEDICEVVVSLSSILRYAISKKDTQASIRDEISHVKNYIIIQKTRFLDLFDVHYEIDEGIYTYGTLKILLQPIVENSIMHGFKDMERGGNITIRGGLTGDTIVFEVEDNGCGMSKERIEYVLSEKNERIGISNINDRVQYIYGEQYGITIASKSGLGTCVRITIPAMLLDETGSGQGSGI